MGGHGVQARIAEQGGRGALPGGVGSGDRTGICQDTGTGGGGHGHTLEDIRSRWPTTRFTYGRLPAGQPWGLMLAWAQVS